MSNKKELQKQKAGAFEFIQKINFILAKIRETNVGLMETKPSEDPTKVAIMRVEFPDSGGILTYYKDKDFPAKGFCYGENVEVTDEVKKTMMVFFRGFLGSFNRNYFKMLLFGLFFRKQIVCLFNDLLQELDGRLTRVKNKPERYCISGREIYRVFNLMMIWYPKWSKILEYIRNIICMVWEYDDAYRYTLQDVFAELKKWLVKKDVIKALKEVIDLIIEREICLTGGDIEKTRVAFKFNKIKKLLFLLNFNKEIKRAVKRFFLELDLEKIKMDEADRYHASAKWGYDWKYKGKYNLKDDGSILQENLKAV